MKNSSKDFDNLNGEVSLDVYECKIHSGCFNDMYILLKPLPSFEVNKDDGFIIVCANKQQFSYHLYGKDCNIEECRLSEAFVTGLTHVQVSL